MIFSFIGLSNAIAQAGCPQVDIDETVSPVFGDECSLQTIFSLTVNPMPNPMPSSDLIVIDLTYISNNQGVPDDDIIWSNTLLALGFQPSGSTLIYQSGPPITLDQFLNTPVANIVTTQNPGECVELRIEFSFDLINPNGANTACSYLEFIQLCIPPDNTLDFACAEVTYHNTGCQPEGLPMEFTYTNTCGNEQTVEVTTDENGEVCFRIPDGECVEMTLPDCESLCAFEDENGNSIVNIDDIFELRRLILGVISGLHSPYGVVFADVNGDGSINTLDLVKIQRHILGIEPFDSECMILDPSSVNVSSRGYSGTPNAEVCDGDNPAQLLVGAVGDVAPAFCDCDNYDPNGTGNGGVVTQGRFSNTTVFSDEKESEFSDFYGRLTLSNSSSKESVKINYSGNNGIEDIEIVGNEVYISINMADEPLYANEEFITVSGSNIVSIEAYAIHPFTDKITSYYGDVRNGLTKDESDKTDIAIQYLQLDNELVITNKEEKYGQVQLYDLNGRLLFSGNQLATSDLIIQLGDIQTGLYILTYMDNDGRIKSEKIFLK